MLELYGTRVGKLKWGAITSQVGLAVTREVSLDASLRGMGI
jgi:hypothetical protein